MLISTCSAALAILRVLFFLPEAIWAIILPARVDTSRSSDLTA